MKPFFVYMLRCSDGSFYVGHTDELERRLAQHRSGEIDGYTHERRPVELAWSQETATREQALAAERQIDGWAHAEKEALIRGDRTASQQHAWGTRNPLPERLRDPGAGQGEASDPLPGRSGCAGPAASGGPKATKDMDAGPGASMRQSERRRSSVEPTRQPVRLEVPENAANRYAGTAAAAGQRPSMPEPERIEARRQASAPTPFAPSLRPAGHRDATPDGDELLQPVLDGERRAIAKAITLLESTRADHRLRADALLNALLPSTGGAIRLGISGVPGVGKSTFIEALGLFLIGRGHRVAVLAVDPSSARSGGSILGDKTRMERLSTAPAAFIRPSPASGTLGGVAEKTREAMLVCEAAGYDVVIVETVGVGQSETAVAGMTDLFVLMQLPNAGDDLQAIKKGVMEIADLVLINKADIDPDAATRAQAQITSALRVFGFHGNPERGAERWQPRVVQLSALEAAASPKGLDAFWQQVEEFHSLRRASGDFEVRRREQALAWLSELIACGLQSRFHHHPAVRNALVEARRDVVESRAAPSAAARALLARYEAALTHPNEEPHARHH